MRAMPPIVLDDLPPETMRRLEDLAARNHVSPSEQVKTLFDDAHAQLPPFKTGGEALEYLRKKYGDVGFEDGEITKLRGGFPPLDLGE